MLHMYTAMPVGNSTLEFPYLVLGYLYQLSKDKWSIIYKHL